MWWGICFCFFLSRTRTSVRVRGAARFASFAPVISLLIESVLEQKYHCVNSYGLSGWKVLTCILYRFLNVFRLKFLLFKKILLSLRPIY